MSMTPFYMGLEFPSTLARQRHRLVDQDFGLAMTPEDLLTAAIAPISRDYYRPWRQMANLARDIGSTIRSEKDKFQINLDVQHFAPEEISVKTADGYVVVEGKHEEKQDEHGYVTRQFTRRYALPEGCNPNTVESKLSSDGVLTIIAPKVSPQLKANERAVPISQTGPVRRKEAKDQAPQVADKASEKTSK